MIIVGTNNSLKIYCGLGIKLNRTHVMFSLSLLGLELKVLSVLGKCFTPELYPQPYVVFS